MIILQSFIALIQGDEKSLCEPYGYDTEYYLTQSDCSVGDRQWQGDTRFTLTPSVIRNTNYGIMVSDLNCLKYFWLLFVM
jgi:hypothetical protein